jgi:glycosyltransferase involved in cell wall biosynthesis
MKMLSAIIPTFKRKESLGRLLEALLAQVGVSLEIMVIDQNPTGYLDELMKPFAGVKHIRLENPNVSTARNLGFEKSSGEIILFIDDDLLPEKDFCKKALAVFDQFPMMEAFSPLVYNQVGKELAKEQALGKMVEKLSEESGVFSITDTISATLFFRRNYFQQTGGFDPYLFDYAKTAEDQEFFLRMRGKKMPFYFVPSIDIFHDEAVPGGCELRTEDYWKTRDKCVRSWTFRHRIHHDPVGKLSMGDLWQLMRSSFLNKEVLLSGPKLILRNIVLLRRSIRSSAIFFQSKKQHYLKGLFEISHL